MVVHKNPYILSCIVKEKPAARKEKKSKIKKKCDTHRISDKRK